MRFRQDVENMVADLRGAPRQHSLARRREESGKLRKRTFKPTELDNLMEVILEQHQIGQDSLENVIMAHWKAIVGERTAHRCRPQRLVNNQRLVILAGNPVVRQELQFMQNKILRKIHQLPGCQCVREVVVLNG